MLDGVYTVIWSLGLRSKASYKLRLWLELELGFVLKNSTNQSEHPCPACQFGVYL